MLGMSDRGSEGRWVWDSDGSPVTWVSWLKSEPNGSDVENCAVMVRLMYRGMEGHRTRDWADVNCGSDAFVKSQDTSLICQKYTGMSQC